MEIDSIIPELYDCNFFTKLGITPEIFVHSFKHEFKNALDDFLYQDIYSALESNKMTSYLAIQMFNLLYKYNKHSIEIVHREIKSDSIFTFRKDMNIICITLQLGKNKDNVYVVYHDLFSKLGISLDVFVQRFRNIIILHLKKNIKRCM